MCDNFFDSCYSLFYMGYIERFSSEVFLKDVFVLVGKSISFFCGSENEILCGRFFFNYDVKINDIVYYLLIFIIFVCFIYVVFIKF